jgi:hypothetical protein
MADEDTTATETRKARKAREARDEAARDEHAREPTARDAREAASRDEAAREAAAREAEPKTAVINRYRIELRHPDEDGTDAEVLAVDEADALAQAEAAAPAGSTLLRIVLMEVDYHEPVPPDPPVSTNPTGTGMAASSARATGVASEPSSSYWRS